ncbi:GntR family transcriptional regulator [Lentzea fradiae]|nr:GntR family transcriptional regulator [Lentzea fradiae]
MSDTLNGQDGRHAADHAYRLIRDEILSGKRTGGDWLREGELADSIGVSRTPVREALRRLTAEGLLTYERNKGVQVKGWDVADLDEIFSLRTVLEPWGCSLAAERGTVDTDQLDDLAHRMDALVVDGHPADLDRLTELNNRFHRAILDGSGNTRLATVLASVVQVPIVWRTFAHYNPESLRRSLAHHHELVTALRAHDGEWAQSVMCSHIKSAWHSIREQSGA